MSSKNKNYHHGNVRSDAIANALEFVSQKPIEALTLRAVARNIAVSHTALYRHFKDREHLLDALAAEIFNKIGNSLNPAQDRKEFVRAYVDFALDNPNLYLLAMSRKDRSGTLTGEPGEAMKKVINVSMEVFRAAEESPKAVKQSVLKSWMILHGAISLRLSGVLRPSKREEFLAMLVKMVEA